MEGENTLVLHLLLLMTSIQGIQGQAITPLSAYVEVGGQVSLECTTTAPDGSFGFSWTEVSTTTLIFTGGRKEVPPGTYVNFNLDEDVDAKRSTLIISNILREDADDYRCTVSQQPNQDPATVIVEVGSASAQIAFRSSSNYSEYIATFEAIGSSPEETITWILNGVTQTNGIVETDPEISDDSLFDKRSVFTFPATVENYNARLDCNISGHQVDKLNRQETRLVDIHNPPEAEGITIGLNSDGTTLTVSCNINNDVHEAIPPMGSFYIYSNRTLVTDKPIADRSYSFSEPDYDTEYMCVGRNYLGNTSATETFYPGRTTTPTPPTAPDTTEPVVGGPTPNPTEAGLSGGEIAGIVVGAIIFITIIIVLIVIFVVKPDCIGGSGSPKTTTTHKHSTSAVGSSNGNEKEKIKPEAAPRGHSSIKHTTDNPQQAEYAMVDRRPGGRGDSTDARGNGAGQNEQPGMHYADLDLTSSAGHSDRVVPKNEDGVVVYSSILV